MIEPRDSISRRGGEAHKSYARDAAGDARGTFISQTLEIGCKFRRLGGPGRSRDAGDVIECSGDEMACLAIGSRRRLSEAVA